MTESYWQGKIATAIERGLLSLEGDWVLVEELKMPERKTASGLIVPEVTTHKDTIKDRTTNLGLVLAVGPGQLMEDGEVVKPRFKAGDVILLPNNVDWYDVFFWSKLGARIGRLRDSMVPMGTTDLAALRALFDEGA